MVIDNINPKKKKNVHFVIYSIIIIFPVLILSPVIKIITTKNSKVLNVLILH